MGRRRLGEGSVGVNIRARLWTQEDTLDTSEMLQLTCPLPAPTPPDMGLSAPSVAGGVCLHHLESGWSRDLLWPAKCRGDSMRLCASASRAVQLLFSLSQEPALRRP